MSANEQILPAKSPTSTITVEFEFLSDLLFAETLAAAHSVTVSVYSGTDANPSALLSGVTSISGTAIRQKITGGVAGNIYNLVCSTNTNLSNILIKTAKLAILPN